ncbi:PREDICTED: uncharacterized protein At1g08160 [Tarenaya hassleriana]|uniref:uncharacterized protein At1g08160 n=1 Tax=Tarenaya hassleriana TaxID=28532 RepID=UPI00053C5676|nr:PREDICTED: uncharacterized protein At1g08160 [Tarenaya hassleriana]
MPPMATPALPGARRRGLIFWIMAIILTLIFLGGLVVLVAWLTIKPKRLDYVILDASVQKYNLTNDNHLSATFQFTIQSHNPNHKISIYYESLELFVKFNDHTLSFDTIEPFHQPRKNVTKMEDSVVAKNVAISRSDARDLRAQTKLGRIDVDVYVRARVRFNVGIWKSSHRTAKIECSPVTVSLSNAKSRITYCNTSL